MWICFFGNKSYSKIIENENTPDFLDCPNKTKVDLINLFTIFALQNRLELLFEIDRNE